MYEGKSWKCSNKSKVTVLSQYMLQLHAAKLVNRKNKAKQDKNSNIPQQNPNLDMSNVKEENICLKVAVIPSPMLDLLELMLNNDSNIHRRSWMATSLGLRDLPLWPTLT